MSSKTSEDLFKYKTSVPQNMKSSLRSSKNILNAKLTPLGTINSVLSFVVVCPHFFGYNKPWWLDTILAVLIFVPTYVSSYRDDSPSTAYYRSIGSFLGRMAMIPYVAALFVTIGLVIFGDAGFSQITRPISIFLQYSGIALLIYSYVLLYGAKAIDRFFYVLVAAYIFEFLCGIYLSGPIGFINYLSGQQVDGTTRQYYELHAICLSSPLLVIIYLNRTRDDRYRLFKALIALAISLAGGKRIALAALILVYPASLFLKVRNKRSIQVIEILVQSILLLVAGIWLYLTTTDLFAELCAEFDVDSMGRITIYEHFRPYIDSDYFSFGLGMGFCELHLQSLVGSSALKGVYNVLGVHNDLLKILIDCGNVGLIAFLVFYICYFPYALSKRFGGSEKVMYYSSFAFALITYMTDNTSGYVVFQTIFFLSLVPRPTLLPVGTQSRRGPGVHI